LPDENGTVVPYFAVVGIAGSALIEMEVDDATVFFFGNNA
jgi:hypothetical protein